MWKDIFVSFVFASLEHLKATVTHSSIHNVVSSEINKIRESRTPKWPRTDVTGSRDFVMHINFENFRRLFWENYSFYEILSQIFEISTLFSIK